MHTNASVRARLQDRRPSVGRLLRFLFRIEPLEPRITLDSPDLPTMENGKPVGGKWSSQRLCEREWHG